MVTSDGKVKKALPNKKMVSFKINIAEVREERGLGDGKKWVNKSIEIENNNKYFLKIRVKNVKKELLKDKDINNILSEIDDRKKRASKLAKLALKKIIQDEIKAAEQDDGTWVNSLLSEDFGDVIKLDLGNRRKFFKV